MHKTEDNISLIDHLVLVSSCDSRLVGEHISRRTHYPTLEKPSTQIYSYI